MRFTDAMADVEFLVNFEDDPLQAHPAYLQSLAPIGFWRMGALTGSTEEDQTANNRDLTYINAPTFDVDGPFTPDGDLSRAVLFNGTDEYAETASSSAWQNLTSAWSLAAWIYPTASRSGSNGGSGIVTAGYAGSGNTIPFSLLYGSFGFSSIGDVVWAGWRHSDNVYRFTKDTASPTLNTWAHYVATWDGATITLYKNGVQVGTPTTPGVSIPAAAGTIPLRVGYNAVASAAQYFPGRIDEVAVYDFALSSAQVAFLYKYLTARTLTPGNYIDLSSRVRSFSSRRGRSSPNSRVEAANATVVLDNRDGLLLPDPVINLLPNPSYEAPDLHNPFSVSVAGTKARVARTVPGSVHGQWRWELRGVSGSAASTYLTTQRDGLVGMLPGEQYTFSAYIEIPSGIGVLASEVAVEIVDSTDGTNFTVTSTNASSVGTEHRVEVTRTIPVDAIMAFCRVKLAHSGVTTEYVLVDSVQLEHGATATTYCDGDQTDCSWGGEAHRSLSHRKYPGSVARKLHVPMRACSLRASHGATDEGIIVGYATILDDQFPGYGEDATVTLSITDGIPALSKQSMVGFVRPSERVGDRVRAILSFAGIADADADVQDEYISALAVRAESVTTGNDTTPLALIRELEETEKGVFFISGDGKYTYQGSLWRSVQGPLDFTFGDGATEIPYGDYSQTIDVETVVNDERIHNEQNNTDFSFAAGLSQQRYFPVAATETSQWQTNAVTHEDSSAPLPHVGSLSVSPIGNPDVLWPMVLERELGDIGRVKRTYLGRDLSRGYRHVIEAIEHDANARDWRVKFLTLPVPVTPLEADPWQTPISRPILFTSQHSSVHGGGTITLPSKTYKANRLYVMFAFLWASGSGTAPVQPGFTSGNTWTSIRADTGVSTSSWRHQTFYTKVGGADVTEALALTFAGQGASVYDIVVMEIVGGFHATPIGVSNQSTVISAFSGYVDVGTLTDARSIILAGFWKNANVDANWADATELYDRNGALTLSYSVAHGRIPGVDTATISWAQANGYHGTGFEVKAA